MDQTPANGSNPKLSLAAWVERISKSEMPIFGHTVQQIIAVSENDEAPSSQLAQVVLQDASMTARVLRLANSPFYNPRERSISTVSRAVVVLGFNTVRSMCLSMALVDAFVGAGAPRERLQRELARSIHAAVQARSLAEKMGDSSPEEVFIATLLFHLGDLAFWCFSGETGDALDTLQRQPGFKPEEAEEEVLGFRLRQLTGELVREWRINELLNETLFSPASAGERGRSIVLCHQLAAAAEQGWDQRETRDTLRAVAGLTRLPETDVRRLLHGNAREAARVAALYGAGTAAKVIPQPGAGLEFLEGEVEDTAVGAKPDGMLQLRILRELSSLLEGKADSSIVMELVLEGIYRGIGMDRTLFALLTPDRSELRAKFMLGGHKEQLADRFRFPLGGAQHVFSHVLEKQAAVWVDLQARPELERLLPLEVVGVTGRTPFFVAPIVVNERSIGLFYADRGLTGRPLDDESYESFRHFAQQASLGLSHLAKRNVRPPR